MLILDVEHVQGDWNTQSTVYFQKLTCYMTPPVEKWLNLKSYSTLYIGEQSHSVKPILAPIRNMESVDRKARNKICMYKPVFIQ